MNTDASVRRTLLGKVEQLEERDARLRLDLQRATTALSADSGERAVEIENDETLERIAEATAAELVQARHALRRFDAGLYGLCERCGESIGGARLQVQIAATKCAVCAAAAESRRRG